MNTATATRTVPVVEVFGPVIQGEGKLAGAPTHFIRLGLCDYRCVWCDSMYAVEPELVRDHAEKLTQDEMVDRVLMLDQGPRWVTLSGGNPAMHELGDLVDALYDAGFQTAVETQGSVWRDWLTQVSCLTVSPKPPSSGMVSRKHSDQTLAFMANATSAGLHTDGCVKIVAFDETDVLWAAEVFRAFHKWDAYLSVGTDPIRQWGKDWEMKVSARQVRDDIGERYAWLCARVAGDPAFAYARVLPQLHVTAFGHARRV